MKSEKTSMAALKYICVTLKKFEENDDTITVLPLMKTKTEKTNLRASNTGTSGYKQGDFPLDQVNIYFHQSKSYNTIHIC